MFEERTGKDTADITMAIFRLGIVVTFVVMVARMFDLQVMQTDRYAALANQNRLLRIETPAPRGVIYDRNGTILVRNRPSFEVALVPEDLPTDDLETEEVDEEAVEIEKILRILQADRDPEVALRMAEILFNKLGYNDFIRTVEAVNVQISYLDDPAFVTPVTDAGRMVMAAPLEVYLPDLDKVLPMEGLVALVKRTVAIQSMGSASDPVPILDGVDRIRAFEISEDSFRIPAMRVTQVPVREYIYGDLLSHVLGFLGPIPAFAADTYRQSGYNNPNERVGLNGLEYTYQAELRGTPGVRYSERNILGIDVRTIGPEVEPVPGWNLHLTIDWRLQSIMREALQAKMEEVGAPWAVTVAMNPQSGEILGMVSLPSYDNNIFAERIGEEYLRLEQDERRPLINYAIGGLYPPGSVFKMVTSLAGLSEGVITPETLVVDAGPIYLPNRYFPNDLTQAQKFVSWNHKNGVVHGRINVESALALSNDIFFYYLGGGYLDEFVGLGHVLLSKWTDLFGFGEKTGIDLPGEVTSLVPTDQWKRQLFAEPWTTGDSYNMAIGQGYVLATPLQVLVETAALANGGILYVPKVVHHMTDANGGVQRDFQPEVKRQLPVDPEHLEVVRRGMWEVVNASYGTGQVARVAGVEVAGKTGTAEFCEYLPEKSDCRRDEKDFLPFHSWFSAFAPYDNPEIAVVTFVYDGGEGSAVAAPITQKILEGYFTEIAPRPQPVATEP